MPPPVLPEPDLDPRAAYPELRTFRDAVTNRNWATIRQVLDGRDAAHRCTLLSLAFDVITDDEDFLRDRHAAEPEDPLASVALAVHLVKAAWRIRGGRYAAYVSEEQFRDFHAGLAEAERILVDVTARHPDDALAWSWRITTARGLELGVAEARRRYRRLADHHPHHLPAQHSMLQQLCPKWGGTWDAAFTFAREAVAAAPPGGHHGHLLLVAHLEQALILREGNAIVDHVYQPEVRAEIIEAAHRSVWHPDFRHDPGWVTVRSDFGLAFVLLGEYEAATAQYAALGHLGDESFYSHLGNGEQQFRQFRTEAYEKGGGW